MNLIEEYAEATKPSYVNWGLEQVSCWRSVRNGQFLQTRFIFFSDDEIVEFKHRYVGFIKMKKIFETNRFCYVYCIYNLRFNLWQTQNKTKFQTLSVH